LARLVRYTGGTIALAAFILASRCDTEKFEKKRMGNRDFHAPVDFAGSMNGLTSTACFA
jgi:hypothetical protein